MHPPALRRVIDQVEEAVSKGETRAISGTGSHDGILGVPQVPRLTLDELRGIVAYEPGELYIRVAAGTPVIEVEAALRAHRQQLPFEPPRRSATATVGGMVAVGLAGPRRMASGPLRNAVLGVSLVDGLGQFLQFGGRVIKNVAGYDVSRILAGSFGTLGVMTEVTLRVEPWVESSQTLCFPCTQTEALTCLSQLRQRPWPIDASAYLGGEVGTLWLRCSGDAGVVQTVDRALQRDGWPAAEINTESATFWDDLRDQCHPFFSGERPLWRLSVPPTRPPLEGAGEWLIEWHGGLRWWREPLRGSPCHPGWIDEEGAAHYGGSLFDRRRWPRAPEGALNQRIESRLRGCFDPRQVFDGPHQRLPRCP